jgi:hypothetical protein
MREREDCNIIHNLVRDIFRNGVHKAYNYFVPTLLTKTEFPSLLASIKGRLNSVEAQHENQLYHTFKLIIKKGEDPSNVKTL